MISHGRGLMEENRGAADWRDLPDFRGEPFRRAEVARLIGFDASSRTISRDDASQRFAAPAPGHALRIAADIERFHFVGS